MYAAGESADRENAASATRRRALRRAERLDMLVASTLLLLLIFGWAVRLAPVEHWPRGDFLVAANARHA
jgi:hypothetical protein